MHPVKGLRLTGRLQLDVQDMHQGRTTARGLHLKGFLLDFWRTFLKLQVALKADSTHQIGSSSPWRWRGISVNARLL